jgi:hypothetical protein
MAGNNLNRTDVFLISAEEEGNTSMLDSRTTMIPISPERYRLKRKTFCAE